MRRRWLIPFPVLALVIGLAFTLGDPARYTSALFNPAREIAPLWVWGVMFCLGALVLTVALLVGNPRLVAVALVIGGGMYTFWALTYGIAAVVEPTAPPAGWAKELALALAHYYAAYRTHAQIEARP